MYKCNKTGYKGVFLTKEGRYLSRISYQKRTYNLGRFTCPIEAAKAYDRKAVELHGPYAKTNFPITV